MHISSVAMDFEKTILFENGMVFTSSHLHLSAMQSILYIYIYIYIYIACSRKGAQCLSGKVIDSRPRGCGFEPHRRHCVVVLEQDTFILA